jgi:hypothetical protein
MCLLVLEIQIFFSEYVDTAIEQRTTCVPKVLVFCVCKMAELQGTVLQVYLDHSSL